MISAPLGVLSDFFDSPALLPAAGDRGVRLETLELAQAMANGSMADEVLAEQIGRLAVVTTDEGMMYWMDMLQRAARHHRIRAMEPRWQLAAHSAE